MAFFSSDIRTIDDLFVTTLRDIHYAEKQISEALPHMIGRARSRPLKRVLQAHLKEARHQIKQIEQVFRMLDARPKHIDCPAIDGILEEAVDIGGAAADKRAIDAALIAAAQLIEHFEIARYEMLIALAKSLDRDDCATVLQQILVEEKAAERKLGVVAASELRP